MIQQILETYWDYVRYCEESNAFCPHSDAEDFIIAEIQIMKPNWNRNRIEKVFRYILIN